MKPESYPFLRIAKKYSVDYGDVLMMADKAKTGRVPSSSFSFYADIVNATEIQQAIRDNEIDWQTGEPTREGKLHD